jgi:hypothetical protein
MTTNSFARDRKMSFQHVALFLILCAQPACSYFSVGGGMSTNVTLISDFGGDLGNIQG